MANRKRGRKGPHRTGNWVYVRGLWKRIVYFDGYEMRQMLPDLDTLFWRGDGSLAQYAAATDEIWIDSRYAAETDFHLKVYRVETMRRWWTRDEQGRYPPYAQLRSYLKKELCLPGPVPPFIERSVWDAENQLNIHYVRGDVVRRYYDPHYVFGGHDLVYPSYITAPRTVWIDVRQDPREIPYTLMHEIAERKLMEKGWSYDKAHKRATEIELAARARTHLVWPARKEKAMSATKLPPLAVELHTQETDSSCGPGSLKMIADFLGRTYRGKPYSEKKLIELCGCKYEGTEHADLIVGAKATGASVFSKDDGTIDELRHFVLKERLPVLVGWWNGPEQPIERVQADHDLDEGHFSVVRHVTRTHVWLADPWVEEAGGAGYRNIPIRQFLRQWHDTDTPSYLPVKRWYMVVNYEGRRFRFPGGANE